MTGLPANTAVPPTRRRVPLRRLLAAAMVALPLLAMALAPVPADAATGVRAATHDGYGRIVFDWDSPVRYDVETAAGQIIIRFDQPVGPGADRIPSTLRDYVGAARVSPDGRTVTLPLKGGFEPRTFTIGTSVVLDLMGRGVQAPAAQPSPPPQAQAAAPAPRPATAPAASGNRLPVRTGEHPGFFRVVFDWNRPVGYRVLSNGGKAVVEFDRAATIDLPAFRAAMPEALRDVGTEARQTGMAVAVPVPPGGRVRHFTSGSKVVIDLLPAAGQQPPARTPEEQQQAPADAVAAAPVPAPPPTATPDPAAPQVTLPGSATSPGTSLAQALQQAQGSADQKAAEAADLARAAAELQDPADGDAVEPLPPGQKARVASLSFSWNEPTAAAVFRRGGYMWVVFDRHQQVDVNLLRRLGAGIVSHIDQLPSRASTIVRMVVEPGYNPSVRREGLLWIVDLMRQPLKPATAIEVQPQLQSPVGPRLYLPVTEGGRSITVLDPEIGDQFFVVPVIPLGHGVFPSRSYPDVEMPATAQGVVAIPKTEKVSATSTRNGVDIVALGGGLRLSGDTARLEAMNRVGDESVLSQVYDIRGWMRGPPEDYIKNRQDLQLAVADSTGERQQRARLELARFYFAHGFAAEAIGVLRTLEDEAPEMVNTAPFRALRGGANYLMGRYGEAVEDLSHPSLAGVDEADFWRAASQAALGDPALQSSTLRQTGRVIGSYPDRVKIPLALQAAEAAVDAAADLAAHNFLEAARSDFNTPGEQAAIRYLEGRLDEATGAYESAIEKWEEVEAGQSRLYRAKAARDRLELLAKMERLDRPELIKGLEDLRFAWRGGPFEFTLLMRLGGLYVEEQKWPEALRTYKIAASYFPQLPTSDRAAESMRQIFDRLYLEGAADSMSPITAIALFDDFRELTPTGAKGDEMIRRLADRLVSMDLLDQAALLLDRQVKFRVQGVERARIGGRLGLVHLLNHDPESALKALLMTRAPDMPQALDRQRNQLMSRALAELDRTDEAIELLSGDESENAKLLRAEIYWRKQDWKQAAKALSELVPEPARNASLDTTQARRVLDWATALTLAADDAAVATLRSRYLGAMQNTTYRDAFDLITASPAEGVIDYRTVSDRIRQAENFQSFLSDYRDRLRQGGALSAIN